MSAQDEATALREYGLRVGKLVLVYARHFAAQGQLDNIDLAAIVASVELPEQEILDAPTCDGWWWASIDSFWQIVYVERDEEIRWATMVGDDTGHALGEFDDWLPLTPPSAPSPADAQREGDK